MSPNDVGTTAAWLQHANYVYMGAVAISLIATFGIFWFGNRYARLKDQELEAYKAHAAERISQAEERSARANAVAEAAKANAETARAEAEEAQLARASLLVRLAEIEKANQELTESAQASKARMAMLEAAARPRSLSPADAAKLSELMKYFAGREVTIKMFSSEPEPRRFADEIAQSLRVAGIKVRVDTMVGGVPFGGTGVAIKSIDNVPDIASHLRFALGAAGVRAGIFVPPLGMFRDDEFFLAIGAKGPVKTQ